MQFMMVAENGPEKFREWEDDFRDVYAYLESIEPPANPYPVDEKLAETGRVAFERVCSQCHGAYGDREAWPGVIVPIEDVQTDRARLDSLLPKQRGLYSDSWFGHDGELETVADPGGYVAPPLDGVWASGPYFHNGSVPTLWHVLHPQGRPAIWKRVGKEFDSARVGPLIEECKEIPTGALLDAREGRLYFDTRKFGKSAAGHNFPDALSEEEKTAVLEYLKTL
jgi:hypothetical protein